MLFHLIYNPFFCKYFNKLCILPNSCLILVQALRNKAFGTALDFVWSALGTGDYAIRESISRVRTFKNFKDHKQVFASVVVE